MKTTTMKAALRKRKRITREELEHLSPSPSSASESDEGEDLQAIFRRAFEAKFRPLEVAPKKPKMEEEEMPKPEEPEEDEETDWSGISSDEDGVEIIEYSDTHTRNEEAARSEYKTFMSSKPPTTSSTALAAKLKPTAKDPEDPDEATHLKNDLALQRLLRDSHLLSTSTSTTPSSTLLATGSTRHKSTDLHLLALGAKASIHVQKRMPMSHRKGITAKAKEREQTRRKEAKEGGIVLEKETRERKEFRGRERGVGGPGVGRMMGGTLRLRHGKTYWAASPDLVSLPNGRKT
ncbi:hypothetical protein P154DRAFT_616944 [Amniculicola lignicola CBS 123094]|uniref:Uncharacterized protein n=1 Tax=Amniculicola lignicola CBS 123094 TaxID=1392246 RepID=A0A6A5WTY1_9PLEO|nr:hypothetical protein P154DRAFT_616944 [Amniculicola lignicola CBS 123094]